MLTNLEITPPPGAWSVIAERLHNEYDATETIIAQKMQDLNALPPATAWENIAAALPAAATSQPAARVVRIPYRRIKMMAAAVVIALTGLATWYLLNYSESQTGSAVVQQPPSAPSVNNNKTTPSANHTAPEVPAIDQLQKQLAQKEKAPASRYTSLPAEKRGSYTYYDYQPVATTYTGEPEVETVHFTANAAPTVEAPLIRDANGQIILDKRLITSPDNCYITITGPNGQQTRISSKFLDIISSLNADAEPPAYLNFRRSENNLWKIRFSEWRNKLMNQASFIPTATNFLDMLELKEMLQENQ